MMKQFHQDTIFYEEHRGSIAREYNDGWVAIYQGIIIAHESELQQLADKLVAMKEADGLPAERAVLRHAVLG
ncbi:MAG: hypothetical protein AB7R89_03310 [Dehalococcoidia bacterium]